MSIYLLKENNEIGPLTTDELQALLDANCINKDQLVRLEDGTESVAGTLEGIRLAKREAQLLRLAKRRRFRRTDGKPFP